MTTERHEIGSPLGAGDSPAYGSLVECVRSTTAGDLLWFVAIWLGGAWATTDGHTHASDWMVKAYPEGWRYIRDGISVHVPADRLTLAPVYDER